MLRCLSAVSVENPSGVGTGPDDSDLVGIRKVWWDGSHDPSVAMEGHRQTKKVRRWSCPLVREQLECLVCG